jgi:thiosulfate dehydrogenase
MNKFSVITVISISLIISDSIYKSNLSKDLTEPKENKIESRKAPIIYPWKVPDEKTIPTGIEGEYVRYGQQLVSETYKYVGPEVNDLKMRFAGNNMSCKNCHLGAGTKPFTSGFIGVYSRFPQFRTRSNSVETLEDRINGCFERSLNGKSLTLDGKEMKAIVMYMKWLSSDIPVGAKVEGQGLMKLPLPDRAASPENGKKVFVEKCMTCHGINGQGLRKGKNGDAEGYFFPPLWGKDSFNDGAGINRLITAASFIKANMPFESPDLSIEQAYDVAAYIVSQERPKKQDLEKDFPIPGTKPVDCSYPPFNDNFTAEQHKYGPFQRMLQNK